MNVPVSHHYTVVDDRGFAHSVTKEGFRLVQIQVESMAEARRRYEEVVARVTVECRAAGE